MAKSAQTQLVELFNAANTSLPVALTVADVDFGAVAAAAEGAEKNSKLTITAKGSSVNFSGSKELTYNRISFAPGGIAVNDDVTNWDTNEEILAHFNALVQQGHADDEFALADLTIASAANPDDAQKTDITVAIKDGHLKYLPGASVKWTISKAKTDLSGTDGDLDGFN